MKKILFVLVILVVVFSENAHSQCKFKKIQKYYLKSAKSENCSVDPEISTKPKKLMNKPYVGTVIFSFVKSGEEYYLYFFIARSSSSKFEIHENNSLVLLFENGDPVSVLPCGYFKPRALPLMDCNIGAFYKIEKDQIQLITDNGNLFSFIIHVTADKEIPSAQIDEDGTKFFEYEIHSEKFKSNLSHAAACILTK